MGFAATLLCVLLALPYLRLAAQDPRPLASGERVRVSAPAVDRDRLIGTVTALGADSLVLQIAGRPAPVGVPLAAVQTLEVSRGRHSHTLQGAGVGLFVGAAVGAAAYSSCEGDFVCPGPAGGAAIVGALFAIPGAIIGALARSERWESMPLRPMTASPGAAYRRLALGVSVSF